MNKFLTILAVVGLVILQSSTLSAQSVLNAQVFSSGGSQAAASGKILNATFGQAFASLSGASGKNIGSGYWYTITESAVSTDLETIDSVPGEFSLSANYPNPFNPETSFHFNLATQSRATLIVYDMLGNKIETIVDQELPAGEFRTSWNAAGVSSGTYFYRLEADGQVATRKMTLMK